QTAACSLAHAHSHPRLAPSLPAYWRQHLAHYLLPVDQLRQGRCNTDGSSLPHPFAHARGSYPKMFGRGTDLTSRSLATQQNTFTRRHSTKHFHSPLVSGR